MYKGKRLKQEKPRRWQKSKAMLVSLLLIIGVTISGTLAYIVADSGPVKNTFTPSEVTTEVVETVCENTKSNVQIKNTGDTTAYIRAAVVITWQDENGNVLGELPAEETDYAITYNLDSGWKKGADGFYYWTAPVLSDDEDAFNCHTGVLINSCEAKNIIKVIGAGEDTVAYHLAVEVIGSGIQSVPTTVVTEEWDSCVRNVSDDGTLTIT